MRYQNLTSPTQMENQYRFTELLYCAHFKRHLFHKRLSQETETLIWEDKFKNLTF